MVVGSPRRRTLMVGRKHKTVRRPSQNKAMGYADDGRCGVHEETPVARTQIIQGGAIRLPNEAVLGASSPAHPSYGASVAFLRHPGALPLAEFSLPV